MTEESQLPGVVFRRYVLQGSEADLHQVFDMLFPKLFKVASKMGLDAAAAEDAVQETFMVILRRRDSFKAGASFDGWASEILARVVRSEWRRRERHLRALGLVHADNATGSESAPWTLEFESKVRRSINALPEATRSVVSGVLLEGRSVDEVARQLEVSKNAASVRLHRGLKRLRGIIGASGALLIGARLSGYPRGVSLVWQATRAAAVRPAMTSASASGAYVAAGVCLLGVTAWIMGMDTSSSPPQPPGTEPALTAEAEGTLIEAALPSPGRHRTTLTELGAAKASSPSMEDHPPVANGVAGQVVDEQGRAGPAGMSIYLLDVKADLVLPTAPLVPVATTDATGAFKISDRSPLSDDAQMVLARGPSLVAWAVCAPLASGAKLPDLVLRPSVSIEFTVVDENQRPVAGAHVAGYVLGSQLTPQLEEYSLAGGYLSLRLFEFLFGGSTDSFGRARVEGMTRDGGREPPTICGAWKAGFIPTFHSFSWSSVDALECTLVLHSVDAQPLYGSVVDAAGAPLADVALHAAPMGTSIGVETEIARSDASGRWSLPSERLEGMPMVLTFALDGFASQQTHLRAPEDLQVAPMTVVLAQAMTAGGRVVDMAGKPLPGVEVTALIGGLNNTVSTDGDGRFELGDYAQGPATILVTRDAPLESRLSHRESIRALGPDLVIRVPRAEGRVHELNAKFSWPSAHREAQLERACLVPREVAGFETHWPLEVTGTDSATVSHVPTGSWVLFASDTLGNSCVVDVTVPTEVEAVEITAAFHHRVDVDVQLYFDGAQVPESGVVIGRLATTSVGSPSWLRAGKPDSPVGFRIKVDSAGFAQARGLTPGTWQISYQVDGWASEPTTMHLRAGGARRADIQAVAAGALEISNPSVAIPGIWIFEVRRPAESDWMIHYGAMLRPDRSGPVRVNLPPGSWKWRIVRRSFFDDGTAVYIYPTLVGDVEIVEGQTEHLDLRGRTDLIE